jgi:hypothetical protein
MRSSEKKRSVLLPVLFPKEARQAKANGRRAANAGVCRGRPGVCTSRRKTGTFTALASASALASSLPVERFRGPSRHQGEDSKPGPAALSGFDFPEYR